MSLKKKIISLVAVVLGIIVIAEGVFLVNTLNKKVGASVLSAPSFIVASSTKFTLTTASQRLLATSTPTKRMGALIQNTNCTAGSAIFLSMNRDVAAVAQAGVAVLASSTLAFGDYPESAIVQGAVTGIAGVGTCTVLVTEWRSQY